MPALTNAKVKSISTPGRYTDGDGLQLLVKKSGAKMWVMRYSFDGSRRDAGLGGYPGITLAEARAKAAEIRAAVASGVDPRKPRRPAQPARSLAPTFAEVADKLIAASEASWRNPKHRQQWRNTLERYAAPIASSPVDQVRTRDVLACVEPIWLTKAETAARVRGRIERVFDYAIAMEWRPDELGNPAMMKGKLQHLLPKRDRSLINHREAMGWREIPAFVESLSRIKGTAATAVIFTILTAARSGEVRLMTWDELDLDAALWTIPKTRMKMKMEHRVPLSSLALKLVADQPRIGRAVFSGARAGKPMSDMTMLTLTKRYSVPSMTVHGFRSSFKDWALENGHSDLVSEMCLAHVVGDTARNAYARTDMLEARRALISQWGNFVAGPPAQ
mgnify:CR=1 FL=1